MEAQDPLEKFGKFLVENLRDRGINYAHGLLNNHWKTPAIFEIQTILSNLDVQGESYSEDGWNAKFSKHL